MIFRADESSCLADDYVSGFITSYRKELGHKG